MERKYEKITGILQNINKKVHIFRRRKGGN
jgi:hypothetical protein